MSSHAGERDEPDDRMLVASRSDVGRVRAANEDSCGSFRRSDGARLLVVADGMGGHRGGATASREALATIADAFEASAAAGAPDPADVLRSAIERANEHLFGMATEDPGLAGMGTTVVAFLLDADGRATVAHVGDSRAYRLRGGRLEALTTDHSVVAEMLRRGVLTAEEAAYHPRRNEILRSVGVLDQVDVEVGDVALEPGDWVLLCSDGLCGVVSDAEIEEVLVAAAAAPQPLERAADALVDLANECGGPDNVTVALLALLPGWRRRPHTETLRDVTTDGGEQGLDGVGVGGSAAPRPRAREVLAARAKARNAAISGPLGAFGTALRIVAIVLFAVLAWLLWQSR